MKAGTYGYTALSSATPLPIALAIVTRPARAAFTTPGIPSTLSGSRWTGSRKSSSMRR